ncbi:MAG: hypothetical protein ACXW5U_32060 [Thermoanaerobaculia bacterium]
MTKATPQPTTPTLNIDGFRFSELHIAPAHGADGAPEGRPSVHVEYDLFSHPEQRHRFAVGLKIVAWIDAPETHDASAIRSEVRVSAIGFLTSTDELPRECDLPLMLAANGLALLYGIIRGVIATAGGWFEAPALLPTVNFSRMLRDRMRAHDAHPAPEVASAPVKRRRRKLNADTAK